MEANLQAEKEVESDSWESVRGKCPIKFGLSVEDELFRS